MQSKFLEFHPKTKEQRCLLHSLIISIFPVNVKGRRRLFLCSFFFIPFLLFSLSSSLVSCIHMILFENLKEKTLSRTRLVLILFVFLSSAFVFSMKILLSCLSVCLSLSTLLLVSQEENECIEDIFWRRCLLRTHLLAKSHYITNFDDGRSFSYANSRVHCVTSLYSSFPVTGNRRESRKRTDQKRITKEGWKQENRDTNSETSRKEKWNRQEK